MQVSILETGEVCMELLKAQGSQERVKEVLRISCDGSMVGVRPTALRVTVMEPEAAARFPFISSQ